MLFNSFEYVILLSATLLLYWVCPILRLRQLVVLSASLIFYMTWSIQFGLMLLLIIGVNWLCGAKIERNRSRKWLAGVCVANLGMLAYFKYMGFFLENLEAVLKLGDPAVDLGVLKIVLPLGISFYVFELISYQVDVHRGRCQHERDFCVFAIFVLFFPHLIAGPICRAGQFIPQLHVKQELDVSRFFNGIYYFVCGLALKCAIADGLAPYVNVIFKGGAGYSGFDNLMAVIAFGVQILCDFWGYSLMALGAALLFGYVLPYNFNNPYAAASIQDFWRRWHITLSNWLRDYLYIGLGGSRTGKEWKTQRNLLLTMLLGGLWHGASWNFVIWGGLHGVALVTHRGFSSSGGSGALFRILRCNLVSWLLTMSVVFLAWVFFRASSFAEAIEVIGTILRPAQGWLSTRLSPVFYELLLVYIPLQWWVHKSTYDNDITHASIWKAAIPMAFVALFATIYYVDGNDFIYFQF